jgi:hypothetical protein
LPLGWLEGEDVLEMEEADRILDCHLALLIFRDTVKDVVYDAL